MTDYFERLDRNLGAGDDPSARLLWCVRARRRFDRWPRRARGLALLIVALLVAAPALAAVGLLKSGSPVAPNGPSVPSFANGVVDSGGASLLGLRVPDPAGGPPWGLRITRTTRGLVCLTVGRVSGDRVGALGRDGAFVDDGLFHPFAAHYVNGSQCVAPDAHGHPFEAVAWYGAPASALAGGGCAAHQSCPPGERRDVYFGLLGPEATEVAYRTASGKIRTESTFGSVGAYLVVERQAATASGSFQWSSSITSDMAIRGVAFRTGDNCGVLGPQNRGRPFFGCKVHD